MTKGQRTGGRRHGAARHAAAVVVASLLAACAADGTAPRGAVPAAPDAQVRQQIAVADIVLLGELHDNPAHHARRGAWLATLAATPGRTPVVVAEQLTRGRRVDAAQLAAAGPTGAQAASDAPGPSPGPSPALLPALEAAGFDASGWAWPLHQALFEPVLRAGLPLWGGNLPRDQARRIAREGETAWPADLAQLLRQAPLADAAQRTLDASLLDSHCGMLSAQRVPAMRSAQRARDASMAQALLAAHQQGARPAVLVAGNGHVRRDHGVAQLLAVLAPQLQVVSVGLGELPAAAGPDATAALAARLDTDLAWAAPPVAGRVDPCAAMRAAGALRAAP